MIEDGILSMLVSSGNLLGDETLINELHNSKRLAEEIVRHVGDSRGAEEDIEDARDSYRPIAKRASLLYGCVQDLEKVDSMYQYSLEWFIELLDYALTGAPRGSKDDRLPELSKFLGSVVVADVGRGLFERDKALFVFMVAVRVSLQEGELH
jgi:dynein heavy chain